MKKLLFLLLLLPAISSAQSWELGDRSPSRAVTNGSSWLGKGAGTIEAPIEWDVSVSTPDTSAWRFIAGGSGGKNIIMTNRSTYLGKTAGTVYIQLVYGVNSISTSDLALKVAYSDSTTKYATPTSVKALIGDTAYIGHTNQAETITGDWSLTGAPSYKTFKTTPVAITNDTLFATTGSAFTKTLAANTTFKLSGLVDGQTVTLAVTNTASNYTVGWS